MGMLILFVIFYLAPAIVGSCRGVRSEWAIFAFNLLLGWTAIGWIAALVWALAAKKRVCGYCKPRGYKVCPHNG